MLNNIENITGTTDEIIDKIIKISLYHNVLCKFKDGQYRLGRITYYINADKKPVPIYSPANLGQLNYSGKPVFSYEDLIKNNIIDGWHGDYTDGQEPKKNEECIILIQELRSYGERYRVEYAFYDGKIGFFRYKTTPERCIIGFKHIHPDNGLPY